MQVIIAEKPSVAREIAAIVGATNRKDGFIEGNGYAVTWAFGHLVGLAMPQQYGIAGFRRENLPILPSSFILLPRQVREGKEYKADPGVVKQLGILRELFGMAERIIVATDAGREGELIFRYIYSYLECRTPFVRKLKAIADLAAEGGVVGSIIAPALGIDIGAAGDGDAVGDIDVMTDDLNVLGDGHLQRQAAGGKNGIDKDAGDFLVGGERLAQKRLRFFPTRRDEDERTVGGGDVDVRGV